MRKEYDFSKGKRGAVVASAAKTRITIMLDADVLAHFRQAAEMQGVGYQTLINSTLRAAAAPLKAEEHQPLTVATLRAVLRQELSAA